MANTKVTSHVIANNAISASMIQSAAVTDGKLHSTLDLSGKTLTLPAVTLPSASVGTTQSASDNSTKLATTAYVTTAIGNLVDSAPGALDTLNELAAALGDDASFSSTVTTQLATKLPLAGGTLTGALTLSGAPTNALHPATKAYTDTADALKLNLSGGTLTGDLILNTTTALQIPAGTTGQRPSAVTAQIRWNTTDGALEVYNGSAWTAVGTGSSNKVLDTFTGDGSTDTFTLSVTPANEDAIMVFIDGAYQEKSDYVLTNNSLELDTAPLNNEKIAVHTTTASVHDGTSAVNQQFTGDGSTTDFTLSQSPGSENNTQVYINGVYQQKTDYTVTGTTLAFDTAPTNGDIIEVNMFTVATLGNTDTVTEGVSNQYFTDARARGAISVSGNAISYNSSTGVLTANFEEGPAFTSGGSFGGALGIGDTTPSSQLVVSDGVQNSTGISGGGTFIEIARTSGGDAGLIIQKNTSNWVMGIDNSDGNAGPLRFEYSAYGSQPAGLGSGTLALALGYNGNVGIGASNPNYQVHIKKTGSAEIELEGTVSAELNLHDSGGSANTRRARLSMNGTDFKLSALNDADDTVTYEFVNMQTDNGYVGIGSVNPGAKLHVDPAENVTTGYGTPLVKVGGDNSWAGNGSLYSIGFGYVESTLSGNKSPAEIGFKTATNQGWTKGDLVFATRDATTNSAPSQRMCVKASGNVGIATDNPQAKLSVNTPLTQASADLRAIDIVVPGSWSLSGNAGHTSDITWTNAEAAGYVMGKFGLRYAGTSTGGNSEFVFKDMYHGGYANSVDAMYVGSNGIVMHPNQPYFEAYRSGAQSGFNAANSYSQVVIYNSVQSNVGGHYNNSTGFFTAPVTGVYSFVAAAYVNFTCGQAWFSNASGRMNGTDMVLNGMGNFPAAWITIRMAANDTIGFHPYASGTTSGTINANANHTYFRGALIG